MSDINELIKRRSALRGEKEGLEILLSGCPMDNRAQRRKLRVQIAMIDDKILSCSDHIRSLQHQAQVERERAAAEALRLEKQRQRDQEAEYQAVLSALLEANARPAEVDIPLKELAKSYRYQADVIRHRIQLVSELRPRTAVGEAEQAERLRILSAMLRDLRDMAVICERYYQPGYRLDPRYSTRFM